MGWAQLFSKLSYILFLGILMANLYQKKYDKRGEQKRFAGLYLGMSVFFLFIASGAIIHSRRLFGFQLDDRLALLAVALIAAYIYIRREKTLPFRFRCQSCGKKLTWERVFFIDSNLCNLCEGREKKD